MKEITLIDYDMGNTFSVTRAFESFGCKVNFSNDPYIIEKSENLVLPGVGAFEDGIRNLKNLNLDQAILNFVKTGRPILGICVGMQLMMTRSEENGNYEGLNLVEGDVLRFTENLPHEQKLKIPQIGWNHLKIKHDKARSKILNGLEGSPMMYFLHSYYVKPKKQDIQITETVYGGNTFCSAFQDENIYGFQFHPEKSSEDGLALLRNFSKL